MMPTHSTYGVILLAALLCLASGSGQAADSRFEIDLKELPASAPSPAKGGHQPAKPGKRSAPQPSNRRAIPDGTIRYTVKPGDHIFKILMRDFGLSNQQAERIIPDIARQNGIDDIRRLRVGQELLISLTPSRRAEKPAKARPDATPEPALPARATEQPAEITAPVPPSAPSPPPKQEAALPAASPPVPPLTEQPSVPAPPATPPLDQPARQVRVAVRSLHAPDMSSSLDILLDLLAPGWGRNRIVETGRDSNDGSYMSIKVDRYFEYLGHRFIVNSENDPLTLTLLRLLEVNGARVVNIGSEEGIAAVASTLVAKMELARREGSFRVKCLDQGGGEYRLQGIWVAPAPPFGQQQLITADQVPGCTAELLDNSEPPVTAP